MEPKASLLAKSLRIIEIPSLSLFLFFLLAFFYILIISSTWSIFFLVYYISLTILLLYILLTPLMTKREALQNQVIQFLFLFIGLGFTLMILVIAYGDLALLFILKGISIENLRNIIIELNLQELFSWFYFIILYFILYFIEKLLLKNFLIHRLSDRHKSIFSISLKSFKEGSLMFPFVIMIAFPMILQIVLPILINSIVIVELTLPFILLGELYRISEENLKKFFIQNQRKLGSLLLISVFPLSVLILIQTDLVYFLNLVYYNFLWPNSESIIAAFFWNAINTFFSIISFNNAWLFSFYDNIKLLVVSLILLAICSKLYLILKHIIGKYSIQQIDKYIMIY
ncbi:MAG: hypothetical protein ACXAC8_02775 [Candidatus Hodarchaeales archaeon]|jgi:hypothetical protein